MPPPAQREHSVETIRRNSEVMGNLRKLLVANRGVCISPPFFFLPLGIHLTYADFF
jgi:hypothetical protein